MQEISEHIEEARKDLDSGDEAEVRTLLDRLGDPVDIAAEARERFGVQPKQSGALEVVALILLPIGGIILPILGWVLGVIFLWVSDVWSRREKLIGTFVIPGGIALPFYLFIFGSVQSVETCGGSSSVSGAPGGSLKSHVHIPHVHETCSGGTSTFVAILAALLLIVLLVTPFVTSVWLARRMRRRSRARAGWSAPGALA